MTSRKNNMTEGSIIQNFSLQNQDGEVIELEALLKKGRVLLFAYPKAMTPGCTLEAKEIEENLSLLKKEGITPVGISPDPVSKLTMFCSKEGLSYNLLSDLDKDILKMMGAFGQKKFMGKEYEGVIRSSLLIGKDRKIEASWPNVKAKDHMKLIKKYLGSEA